MIITNTNGNLRTCVYANPEFDNSRAQIVLRLQRTAQVQQSEGVWTDIDVAVSASSIVISDDILINPTTYVITPVTGTPAYTFLTSRTLAQIGAQSLDDYVYALIAAQIETYLTANNLVS